jgi:hypothetical protein
MAEERSGSILAADFGNVTTRAILIDLVDGVYRLVARGEGRTTAGFPVGDVSVGLKRVAEQISAVTGRKLLHDDGLVITPERPDRSGVDHFVMTASTGRSLRTVLIGLVPDVSLASGVRAAAGTYIDIVEVISLDDDRSEEDQLNAILSSHPDLVFITGGIEDGAQEPVLGMARMVRLAVTLLKGGKKPTILYAGNSALVPPIEGMFDGLATVLIAPNIRPSLDEEELEGAQLQLALAYDERQSRQGSGFEVLGEVSRYGVLPTAQSYNLVVDYLGKTHNGNILAVDIGSAVGTLSAYVDGKTTTVIRTDIGVGHSAQSLLDGIGTQAIRRWLPFADASNQIRHYTLNKLLRPGTIPETLKGLYIEHGLVRAGIGALLSAARPMWAQKLNPTGVGDMPPFSLIIGAGAALTKTGHPGFNALLLLDALQPTGVTTLQADPYGLIAALGALARVNPGAVVQVLDGGSLERLGVCFALDGQPALNRTGMKVKITTDEGEVIKHEVAGGHLWVYPLGIGRAATVEVRASGRGTSMGGRGRVKVTVEGGAAGLIFDGRGRPLPLAADARGRAAQMPLWISEITGDSLIPIQDDWLIGAAEEGDVDDSIAARPAAARRGRRGKADQPVIKPKRGGLFGRGKGKAEPGAGDDLPEPDFDAGEPVAEEGYINELDELRGGR